MVIHVLCWFCVIFPFVLWYFGVRTPRDRREAKGTTAAASSPAVDEHDGRARIAG